MLDILLVACEEMEMGLDDTYRLRWVDLVFERGRAAKRPSHEIWRIQNTLSTNLDSCFSCPPSTCREKQAQPCGLNVYNAALKRSPGSYDEHRSRLLPSFASGQMLTVTTARTAPKMGGQKRAREQSFGGRRPHHPDTSS